MDKQLASLCHSKQFQNLVNLWGQVGRQLHENNHSGGNDVGNVSSVTKKMDLDDVDEVEWDSESNDMIVAEEEGSLITATNLTITADEEGAQDTTMMEIVDKEDKMVGCPGAFDTNYAHVMASCNICCGVSGENAKQFTQLCWCQ